MSSYLVELGYDRSTPVTYADQAQGRVPTSAQLYVEDGTGSVLASPTCTVTSTSTTVAAGSTSEALVLTSATGWSVGDWLAVTWDGQTQAARIVRLDGSTAYLAAALSATPDTASAIKRLAVTATISALGETRIGAGYRLRWELSNAGGSWQAVQPAAVVRWLWSDPATATVVREWIASAFGRAPTDGEAQAIARRANDRVRIAFQAGGRWPHLFPSFDAMRETAFAAIKVVAVEHGYYDRSDPQYDYRAQRSLGERIAELRAGALDYDPTGSGSTASADRTCLLTMRASR